MECGNEPIAYAFFISFMIIVSFVFLNLFIAIILESFNTSQNEEGLKIGQQTLSQFSEIWSEFDKKGKCFIKYHELEQVINRLILEESQSLYDARMEMMEGEMDQSEFDNQNYMFNLHKNEFLSGSVLLKQAEIAKKHNQKEEEDEANVNVVKVGDDNEIESVSEEKKA